MSVAADPQISVRGVGRFGASLPLYARFTRASVSPNNEGTPYLQADITSITYTVYQLSGVDLKTRTAVSTTYTDAATTLSAVVFDTLQPWWQDGKGYNFKHTVPPGAFATGNIWYDVDYKITYADGVTVGVIPFQVFVAA